MEKNSISAIRALSNGTKVPSAHDGIQEVKMITEAPGAGQNCNVPPPTQSNNINIKNLINSSGDVVQFDITNGSLADTTLVLGLGILNVTGVPGFYGINNAAVDEPLVTDSMGAGVPHMQLFSRVVNGNPYLIKSIKIFNVSAAQVSEQIIPTTVTPNLDIKQTKGAETKFNSDLNYAILDDCVTPMSFFSGALYKLKAGESITVELGVLAVDAIGNFTDGIG